MSSTNLERFFAGNFFKVPSYQRDYAWTNDNVDELIEDIFEVIETKTNHYIGTFILSETGNQYLHVVDGQQRLTTLTILLRIVIDNLDSEEDKIVYSRMFMKEKDSWRLVLLNDNDFLKLLLERENPQPETKSQHNLLNAYQHTRRRIEEMSPESVEAFLHAIRELEVMEFIESDYGRAIRIFQTVNDRGLPLSNIEKAKSLLVYYSNRFLEGTLDEDINKKFGSIFRLFNEIKTIGGLNSQEVKVINEKRFTEDTVMRYHLLAYDGFEDYYDYRATESDVIAVLKKAIKPLKSNADDLETFIRRYIDDLEAFFSSFQRIVNRISENEQYFKLFSLLEISASLYPLLIRLEARDLLSKEVEALNGMTFLDLLEIADVRVYKVRNTNPLKDITILAKDSNRISPREIEQHLIDFINNFMGNSEFRRALNAKMYTQALVPLIKLMIVEYDEEQTERPYSLEQMKEINSKKPTVEHIFSQEERFDFPNFGFESHEEYAEERDKIGNLTLLEQSLNSKCVDRIPDDKWSYYDRSIFEDPKRISAHARNKGGFFKKEDIAERAERLIPFCLRRWNFEDTA